MRNILILGDYSGNNTGHNALLLSIIHEIENLDESCCFFIPTLKPRLLQRAVSGKDNVVVFGIAPWNLSIKFLNYRIFKLVKKADCILFTDNLFYDSALFNPFKNNLFSLFILVGYAQRHSKPIVYYNGGVGPLKTGLGRLLVKKIASGMNIILLRDSYSKRLLYAVCGKVDCIVTADSGFNISDVSYLIVDEQPHFYKNLKNNNAWIGINLSYHLLEKRYLKSVLAYSVDEVICRIAKILEGVAYNSDCGLIFYITHPNDRDMAERISENIKGINMVLIDQAEHDLKDMISFLLRADIRCFIGTRYHEMVMFSSMNIPIIGISCGDKNEALFTDIFSRPELLIELDALLAERGTELLKKIIDTAFNNRAEAFKKVQVMKGLARKGAHILDKEVYAG